MYSSSRSCLKEHELSIELQVYSSTLLCTIQALLVIPGTLWVRQRLCFLPSLCATAFLCTAWPRNWRIIPLRKIGELEGGNSHPIQVLISDTRIIVLSVALGMVVHHHRIGSSGAEREGHFLLLPYIENHICGRSENSLTDSFGCRRNTTLTRRACWHVILPVDETTYTTVVSCDMRRGNEAPAASEP